MIFAEIVIVVILLIMWIIPSTEKFRFKILEKLYEDINKKDYIVKTKGKGKLKNKLILHEYENEIKKETSLLLDEIVGNIAHGDYKSLIYLWKKLDEYERKEFNINLYKEEEE